MPGLPISSPGSPAKAGVQRKVSADAAGSSRTPAFAGERLFRLAPFAALAMLGACARQSAAAVAPEAPGFLLGLWHGFIFPLAWILSLFMPEVSVYAVPNNGGWYDFGYFLGIAVFGVGARKSTRIVYRDRVIRERAATGSHTIHRPEEEV